MAAVGKLSADAASVAITPVLTPTQSQFINPLFRFTLISPVGPKAIIHPNINPFTGTWVPLATNPQTSGSLILTGVGREFPCPPLSVSN